MSPDILLEKFIRHLRVERGLSPCTWATYGYQLRGYLNFLHKQDKELNGATRDDILAYLEQRKNAGLKSSSLFGAAIAIRGLHRFLADRKHAASDPSLGLKLPKLQQTLPQPLGVAEMTRLLDMPTGNKFHRIRMRAALELLYATGIRISEAINLKLWQVNLEENTVKVRGKGGRERIVPIGTKAKEALICYLEARSKRFPLAQDTLFLNSKGQGLSRGVFWWQLRQMARRTGITTRVTPHVLRHSAATAMLEGGASIRVIQEMLGHSNLSTTIQRYTHVSPEFLRRACEKTHPRFKFSR